MQDKDILASVAPAGWRRMARGLRARTAWAVMPGILVLCHGASSLAGPLDDAGARSTTKFEPVAAPPQVIEARLDGIASSVHVAAAAQGTLYAATDKAGKARVWLLRNNAIVAEVAASASGQHMKVDWPASFAFWLGGLPVAAISWKFAGDAHGIEDLAFWAVDGGGRFLGGLPDSTRSACTTGGGSPNKDCGRCGSANGIPLDARLVELKPDRARFVQLRAATWYNYFGAAAETFEQDFLLTAKGLVPDGPARRTHNVMPLPQAKERVKGLLRDYFKLAKSQSRESIAPEFLTCFEQLVELAPEFGQAHYNVGCMQALLGNHKQAVASVTKALTLNPEYRKLARRDPDLTSVRDDPEIVRLLGEPGE